MYNEPCPACKTPVEFDPYEGTPAKFGVSFSCPHCGVKIELLAEDTPASDGSYDWVYWFERSVK